MRKPLRLATWNVSGLCSERKQKEIADLLAFNSIDIVAVQESWGSKIVFGKPCTSQRRGVLPVRGDGPPQGGRYGTPDHSPGLALPTAPVLVVSSISMGGGSSGGGALRKPSLCKQQSLNAKIKVIKDEILRS